MEDSGAQDRDELSDNVGSWIAAGRHLLRVLTRSTRRRLVLVLFLMLAGAAAEFVAIGAVVPFLSLLATGGAGDSLPVISDIFGAAGARTAEDRLFLAAGLFILAAIAAGAIRFWLAWASHAFALRVGHELSVEIQRRILGQPYAYHLGRNSSEAIASLEKAQLLSQAVLLQLMQGLTAVVIAIFIVAALVQIDASVTAIAALAFGTVYAIVFALSRPRLNRNARQIAAALDRRIQLIQESLGGIRDVIIDSSERLYVEEFRSIDRRFMRARLSSVVLGTGPRFVIEAAGMVLIAGIAVVLARGPGGMAAALPVIGALALGAQRLLPLVQQLFYASTVLAGNSSIAEQVLRLLSLPLPEPSSAEDETVPFESSIELVDVTFRYPARARPAVDRANLLIRRGARIVLVGRTGGGKTTLADLIMGLLEPDEGEIRIDGRPLAGSRRRAWRRNIAHVSQSIFLADTSIARNIALSAGGKEIDIGRVREAAGLARIDEFIDSLPDKYETIVGERGVRLSGGQRQRLGIARAIYKNAPVLVLDEATSALDQETERDILASLDQLQGLGRTIVLVTHRAAATAGCDLVVRVEGGRIVDRHQGPKAAAAAG